MKKLSVVGWVVAAAALVGLGAWWRGGPAPQAPSTAMTPASKPAQVVSLVAVQQRDVPVNVEAAGTVVALNSVELRPQVSTTVREVVVKEGQAVRQGDLLFRLDDRADAANLDKARAQLLRDRATLADLERQHQRALELRAQNFIAQSAVDTVLSSLDAQRALVASDQAAVKAAEVAQSYATLRAPLSGRVGLVTVNPGALVTPGMATPLLTISQIDPVGVSFALPEAQLAALLRGGEAGQGVLGAPVTVLLPAAPGAGRVAAAAAGGAAAASAASAVASAPAAGARGGRDQRESLPGTVRVIDNAVDTASGTIKVKAELANPKQQLWPGQYVTVRLTLRTLKDAAVLPQAAVILRGQERLVYVVGDDMLAQLRPVQLRYSAGEWVAVDGVQPGERVVVEGKQNLRPGQAVREAGKGPAAAASGAASGGRT